LFFLALSHYFALAIERQMSPDPANISIIILHYRAYFFTPGPAVCEPVI